MLKISSLASFLQRRLRQLGGDEQGLSAIEFAMVLPVMLTLYLGSVELSQGIAIDRKVTLTARTIADLVAQATTLKTADMTSLLDAAAAIVSPYPETVAGRGAVLKVTVSQIKIDAQGNATIDWSAARNTTPRSGGVPTVPAAFKVPNKVTYLIWGEAEYEYKPAVGYVVTGTLSLKDEIYMRVRQQDRVQYP